MKGYLVAIARTAFWVATPISLTSCINLPPPSPMGEGAVQQYGLINVANDSRQGHNPQPKPPTTVSVTDKGIAITMPKK